MPMIQIYFLVSENVSDTCEVINSELKHVMQWFITNRFSVNLKKTCFMGFRAKAHSCFGSNKISLHSVDIAKVNHAKFLGVLVDDKLTWKSHLTHICNKVAKNIGILNKLRHRVPLNTLSMLYNTLLMPYFNYCNIIWASTKPTRLDHLVKLQKKAIRIICGAKYRQHTLPLFFKSNQLTTADIYKMNIAIFMYRARHCKLPALFQNFFVLNSQVHEHFTRRCGNLHIQYACTDLYKSQLQIYGPKL